MHGRLQAADLHAAGDCLERECHELAHEGRDHPERDGWQHSRLRSAAHLCIAPPQRVKEACPQSRAIMSACSVEDIARPHACTTTTSHLSPSGDKISATTNAHCSRLKERLAQVRVTGRGCRGGMTRTVGDGSFGDDGCHAGSNPPVQRADSLLSHYAPQSMQRPLVYTDLRRASPPAESASTAATRKWSASSQPGVQTQEGDFCSTER